jgi:hypothetical protein
MERYCNAFLQENRLWLQLAFAEMSDRKLLTQHREALIRSLAQLLEEIEPENYAPGGARGPKIGLEFASDPVTQLTIAAGEVQRKDYQASIAAELVKMWRHRAMFMLHLAKVSSMVKLENVSRKSRCETYCGRYQDLVVTPIYTLTHLASSYRQQRDMSPLWNMVFWKHFYKTFTPTCTVCESCRDYYYFRNQNIPVDEKRFRRLQESEKTPYEVVQESGHKLVPTSEVSLEILRLWLEWTKRLAAGESPGDFLPLYGVEGRTIQEIRQERLDEARHRDDEDDIGLGPVHEEDEADSSSQSSILDEDDPESVARARVRRIEHLRKSEISDDEGEEEDGLTGFEYRRDQDAARIGWATQSIAVQWLKRARDSLRAPQLQDWSQPGGWNRFATPEVPLPPVPPPGGQTAPLSLPQIPPVPNGGAAAATGTMPLPPPPPQLVPPSATLPNGSPLPPPPPPPGDNGGGDRGGGVQSFMQS